MTFFSESFTLTDEGVSFRFFFIEKTIPYSEIKRVRNVPIWKALFMGMNPFRPPAYSTGAVSLHVVLIETKKNWLISGCQKNGDEFVRLVSSRLPVQIIDQSTGVR